MNLLLTSMSSLKFYNMIMEYSIISELSFPGKFVVNLKNLFEIVSRRSHLYCFNLSSPGTDMKKEYDLRRM